MLKAAANLDAFNTRYRSALMAFFFRRLRNFSEAEDLTQDVFVRLASSKSNDIQDADAYIFQVAANILRDRVRRDQVRANFRADIEYLDGADVETLGPDRVLEGREHLTAIVAALQDLPERTRAIFLLVRIEKLKQVDVAAHYAISVSAVEKHLRKAVVCLARRLA